jgi:cob(I)alamin adenosyltransferase
MLQVYTGSGKGKTTAALGLILRALGHGRQVLLVRLLKPAEPVSGELLALERFPGIKVINAGLGVLGREVDHEQVRQSILQALDEAGRCWSADNVDLLVIDEINNALHRGLVSIQEVWNALATRPSHMEIVMTGRNAPKELLERADLVTSMDCLRHPLQQGVPARQGIEY